jgi:FKBP-type peptidyl-prolyl cis-trans isomerase
MRFSLVRSRRLVALAGLALAATVAGCSLGGDSTLPPFSDPATQNYATSTGVTIANMTRVNAQLYQQDVVVGTGRVLVEGDSMGVYYVGKLTGGFQFDARARPSTPFQTALDTTRIIRGWVDGLKGMRVGGTRRLAIGPEIAYRFSTVRDQAGNVIIPANSVLVFDVEVAETYTRQ